jgi:conjugative relaxase-like TrwC/TraI family protein
LIRIAVRKKLKALTEYFRRDLSLAWGAAITPRWIGSLAPRLGLPAQDDFHSEGALTAFENLSRGRAPAGIPLLQSALPESKVKRRCAYDMVIAAPKSVTIAALIGEDRRVIEAHRLAIAALVRETELRAKSANRGYRGLSRAVIGAEFLHTHSRENDPHLHTHLVLFNLTRVDPALLPSTSRHPWKSLDPARIYSDCVVLDYIYKSELAFYLRAQGYPVQIVGNSPEISLVPAEHRELFSSARARINELEKFYFGTRGVERARSWINDRFRRSKTHSEEALDPAQVAASWRARMSGGQREQLLQAIQNLIQQATLKQSETILGARALEPYLRDAVREARKSANQDNLFAGPRLLWKKLLPLVMGLSPWHELKPLLEQALLSASTQAAGSAAGDLIAQNIELARRQLLLDRIMQGESVRDLIPVQEILTRTTSRGELNSPGQQQDSDELTERASKPTTQKRSL